MAPREELELLVYRAIEPEDIPFEGNVMASGDPEVDREQEEWVRNALDRGNQAAWCWVRVRAEFLFGDDYNADTVTWGDDSLGGVSYASERELWADLGPEMARTATREAVINMLLLVHRVSSELTAAEAKRLSKPFQRWLAANPEWAVVADEWIERNLR